jgi:uncharacterized protein YacL
MNCTGIGCFFEMLAKNTTVLNAIKSIFWLVMGFFAFMFAIRAVVALIAYFRGEDERERKEAKQKAINNAIGLVVCLLAGSIITTLLNMIGVNNVSFDAQ